MKRSRPVFAVVVFFLAAGTAFGQEKYTIKLKEVGVIRNDLFHFKREIKLADHEILAAHRNWLLNKIKQSEGRRKETNSGALPEAK